MQEELLQNPLVQDLLEDNQRMAEQLSANNSKKDISKVKIPYTKKNKLLMSEGVHNEIYYPATELENARLETEYGLFFDHNDGTSTQVGVIENPHWSNEGDKGPGIYGDLEIIDLPVAQKLEYGLKWGLSPTVDVDKNETDTGEKIATDPIFLSWSLVLNPAVRATMLNKQMEDVKMEPNQNVEKLAEQLAATKLAEELAKKKKKVDDEEKEKAVKEKKEKEEKDKKGLEDENKQLKEELAKIEEQKTLAECDGLMKKELLIGRTLEADKEARFEILKNFSSDQRKILNEEHDFLIESLQLDADEHPEKYLGEEAKGLSEQELSAYTDFVKKFIKAHKGATIADAAKAYKKEKMGQGGLAVKKKYPYPYPEKDQQMSQNIDERQSLSSDGAESDSIENLNEDPHAGAKEMLKFMHDQQGRAAQ